MITPDLDGRFTDDTAYQFLEAFHAMLDNPPPIFHDPKFPEQSAFIKDPCTLKAAQCPRRAGKSRGVGLWLLEPVFNEPGVTSLYLAKTRDSARRIMWRDVLKELNDELGLELHPNESDLTLTNVATGSILQIAGADSSPDQMKRYLGSRLRRCAVDEAAEYQQDLEKLVYEILYPTMADHEGEIALIGSPGIMCKGLFYDVTERGRKGWSVHKWSSLDNPYMRDKIKKQIAKLEEDNPRIRETPWFRRNYLNEWVQETTNLCYKFQVGNNGISEVPSEGRDRILNVLGVDLGFNDDSAFAVASFSVHKRDLNFVDCYKRPGMIISDVAERIMYYQKKYNPYAIVVDGASKQAVEELKQRFGLPLVTANKQGKAEFIEIMNSEFLGGKIKLVLPAMEPLAEEYGGLIWDDKAAKREEHPACANHLADAALYAWRHCFQYLSQPAPKTTMTVEEKLDAWEEREAELIMDERDKPFWERS